MALIDKIKARRDPAPGPPPAEPPGDIVANFPQPLEPDPDGTTRRYMNSNVLNAVVPVAWTETGDKVWVDGVLYEESEVKELMARHPDPETMRGIHNVKRTFEGTLH